MPVVISMLRGVNLGPHNRIKMDALQALYERLGFENPKTYVQSGNVVFKTRERDLAKVARKIEKAIEETFGFRTPVILRTIPELREVIARNPFAARRGIEPNRLLVTFLAIEPDAEARDKILKIQCDPEELCMSARELYIYFPNGMARPKLSPAVLDRALKTPGTGRNWNSVTKLLALAETMEAGG